MVTVGRVAIVETGVMDFLLSDLLRFNFEVVGSKPLNLSEALGRTLLAPSQALFQFKPSLLCK